MKPYLVFRQHWAGTTEQPEEIYSIDELIAKFQLSRVQRGGARFDEQPA